MTRPRKENPSSTEADGPSRRRNRRQALAVAGAAAAAAAVAALGADRGKKAHATTPGNALILAVPNWTGSVQTELRGNADPGAVLWVGSVGGETALAAENSGGDHAVVGHCQSGLGVLGTTKGGPATGAAGVHGSAELAGQDPEAPPSGPGTGVRGHSGTGLGVHGISQAGDGVFGQSDTGAGVSGASDPGPGVSGGSQSGPGVSGHSDTGVGVRGDGGRGVLGHGTGGAGVRGEGETAPGVVGVAPDITPGVHAASAPTAYPGVGPDGGLALEVVGKASFSSAGTFEIPRGNQAFTVNDDHVQENSIVLANLLFPGRPRQLLWIMGVEVAKKGGSFNVYLNQAFRSGPPLRLAYFVTN